MKKIFLAMILVNAVNAFAATVTLVSSVSYQQDPEQYLTEYLKKNTLDENSVYLAVNTSKRVFAMSSVLFDGRKYVSKDIAPHSQLAIYKIDELDRKILILSSTIVPMTIIHLNFGGQAPLDQNSLINSYLLKNDGSIIELEKEYWSSKDESTIYNIMKFDLNKL